MRCSERNGLPGFDGATYRQLLETLVHPLLVFDTTGHLSYCNQAAREAASAGGLLIRRRRLKGSTAALSQRIDRALRDALDGTATVVRCNRGKTAQHWLFHPSCIASGGSAATTAAAAIALACIERSARSLEIFAQAYGLTSAETRVLRCLIAQDATLESMAKGAGISPSTVRSHLKRLFLKTGTHQQRELVRLVLSLPEPPIDA